MTRDRKVADGFIEVTVTGRGEKQRVRVAAIERFYAAGDNTNLILGSGELQVNEPIQEVDRAIQEATESGVGR